MKTLLLFWREIPPPDRTLILVLAICAVVVLCTGCTTPAVRLDNSARLMARPDFPAARDAAPEWCRDALKTINRLEADLERQ